MIEELLVAIKDQIMVHMQDDVVTAKTQHLVKGAMQAGLKAMEPEIIIEADIDNGAIHVHLEYPDEEVVRRAVDEFFL